MLITKLRKPILCISLALLIIANCLWFPTYSHGQSNSKPGALDIIFLIDNSASMFERNGANDTVPLHIQAARELVARLQEETPSIQIRIAVILFGGVVDENHLLELDFLGTDDTTLQEQIIARLVNYTDFRGPIDMALEIFKHSSFGTGHHKAIILFTDGLPQLTDALPKEEWITAYFDGDPTDLLKDDKGHLIERIDSLTLFLRKYSRFLFDNANRRPF